MRRFLPRVGMMEMTTDDHLKNASCHILITLLLAFPVTLHAQKVKTRFENQFSGWTTVNFNDHTGFQLGGRYIPTLSVSDSLRKFQTVSAEISINAYGNYYTAGNNISDFSGNIKPYRLWLRYTLPRLEFRIGLQKINFGSASILRPLMWFDRIDVRDPLQLTDGVYSFLGRYYFQNNVNIWFWTLYGNNEPMGWETIPTKKHTPEFGGRIQIPVPRGEAAISYHHRKAETAFDTSFIMNNAIYPEDRLGIDGKWDLGVGVWFEVVAKHNSITNSWIPTWETYVNLGMDYTFGLGNGLNVITEYFRYGSNSPLLENGHKANFSVLSVNYPFGLMNTITGMVYYNWDQKDWYRFISFQRKYDYLSLYLMAFWNPDRFALYSISEDRNLFAGKGVQLMAVLNF
jgi:hypothetical protein